MTRVMPNATTPTGGFRASAAEIQLVHDVLSAEADRLREVLAANRFDTFGRCGDDPVSYDAASAFSEKVRAIVITYREHLDHLGARTNELEAASKSYGATEGEIGASLLSIEI